MSEPVDYLTRCAHSKQSVNSWDSCPEREREREIGESERRRKVEEAWETDRHIDRQTDRAAAPARKSTT
jgi:hypothetical protein